MDDVIIKTFLIPSYIKQIDSELQCVCSVIDHRGRQNVVRMSLMFLPHFDILCDLLLNRRTATWNLFVNYIISSVMHAF